MQGPSGYGYAILAIRSQTTAAAVARQLRRTVTALDRGLPLEQVRDLEQVIDEQYQSSRVPAELLRVYALASLVVAMMGLYAVMAQSVIQRHREFALRIALGSTRERIFRLVLSGSTGIAIMGITIGGIGSIGRYAFCVRCSLGCHPSIRSAITSPQYCCCSLCLLRALFLPTALLRPILCNHCAVNDEDTS